MATRLAAWLHCEVIGEYGRDYCAIHGTDIAMADLITIAKQQTALTKAALARSQDWLVLDTDAVMTAVWADMMFGHRDPWFEGNCPPADLYLLFDIDLPWVDDGLRVYGDAADRARFFALSRAELQRRNLAWALVSGVGESRFAAARAAIEAM